MDQIEIVKPDWTADLEKEFMESLPSGVCLECGEAIYQNPKGRKKRFCSDACRLRWWHEHRDMSKTAKETKCAACGREFVTDRVQKYCSHACYIAARFGGAHGHEIYSHAV